jgi:hypothetical protein
MRREMASSPSFRSAEAGTVLGLGLPAFKKLLRNQLEEFEILIWRETAAGLLIQRRLRLKLI